MPETIADGQWEEMNKVLKWPGTSDEFEEQLGKLKAKIVYRGPWSVNRLTDHRPAPE